MNERTSKNYPSIPFTFQQPPASFNRKRRRRRQTLAGESSRKLPANRPRVPRPCLRLEELVVALAGSLAASDRVWIGWSLQDARGGAEEQGESGPARAGARGGCVILEMNK